MLESYGPRRAGPLALRRNQLVAGAFWPARSSPPRPQERRQRQGHFSSESLFCGQFRVSPSLLLLGFIAHLQVSV